MHIPDTFEKLTDGVWVRKEQGDSTSEEVLDSYRQRAVQILKSDVRHYSKHKQKIRDAVLRAGIDIEATVNAWAGGHPKLEGVAGFEEVLVFDAASDMYRQTSGDYVDIYHDIGVPTSCKWFEVQINPIKVNFENSGEVRTNTFCHFLEHLTPDTTCDLLRECNGNPIVIYGPDIETAHGPDWFHFRPADHNTFWTGAALARYLQTLGYTANVQTIDNDYLIVATTEK